MKDVNEEEERETWERRRQLKDFSTKEETGANFIQKDSNQWNLIKWSQRKLWASARLCFEMRSENLPCLPLVEPLYSWFVQIQVFFEISPLTGHFSNVNQTLKSGFEWILVFYCNFTHVPWTFFLILCYWDISKWPWRGTFIIRSLWYLLK